MKKIVLKKTVIANLSKDGMNRLKGGTSIYTDCGSGGGPVASAACQPITSDCVTKPNVCVASAKCDTHASACICVEETFKCI